MASPYPYNEVERTSRGVRHCEACCRLIHADVRYKDCSGLIDGLWFRCAMCLPCMDLYNEIRSLLDWWDAEEFAFVELGEQVQESGNSAWIVRWAAIRELGTAVAHA